MERQKNEARTQRRMLGNGKEQKDSDRRWSGKRNAVKT